MSLIPLLLLLSTVTLAVSLLAFWFITLIQQYNQRIAAEKTTQAESSRSKSFWGQLNPFLETWLLMIQKVPALFQQVEAISHRHESLLAWANHPGGYNGLRFEALKQVFAFLAFVLVWINIESFPFALVVAIGAYFLPNLKIQDMVKQSRKSILRDLPDALDSFALMVSAGQDFNQSVDNYLVHAPEGRLKEELLVYKNEIRLGVSRSNALVHFADRIDLQEITDFVRAMIQAERTGTSIVEVLTNQADDLRAKRFHYAEEEGQKATVRILMPLLGLILPACIIVLFGPVAINYFGKGP